MRTWQSSPPDTTRGLLPLEQSTLFTKLVWPFILLILSPVQVSHTPTCQEQVRNLNIISGADRLVSAGGVDGVAIRGELELHNGASVPAHH